MSDRAVLFGLITLRARWVQPLPARRQQGGHPHAALPASPAPHGGPQWRQATGRMKNDIVRWRRNRGWADSEDLASEVKSRPPASRMSNALHMLCADFGHRSPPVPGGKFEGAVASAAYGARRSLACRPLGAPQKKTPPAGRWRAWRAKNGLKLFGRINSGLASRAKVMRFPEGEGCAVLVPAYDR